MNSYLWTGWLMRIKFESEHSRNHDNALHKGNALGTQTTSLITYNIGLLSLKDVLLILGVLPAAFATVGDTTITWRVLWNFKGRRNLFFSGTFLFTCFSAQCDKAQDMLVWEFLSQLDLSFPKLNNAKLNYQTCLWSELPYWKSSCVFQITMW